MLAAPSPAGAHHDPNFKPDHRVAVHETYFNPSIVYARRGQTVQFELAPGVSNHHTVTLDNGKCEDLPDSLCEKTFDDPEHPPVYRFSNYGEYPFHDRYSKEAGFDMSGKIVITDNPPTVPPTNPPPTATTTSTTMSPTTTTRPATTTTLPPTTTTTAPTTIRPFLIGDTGSTTTTTAAPVAGATKAGAAEASPAGDKKGKGKGDGKSKTAATDPPATAASASPEGSPIEVLFDASTLTPLPEASPTADGPTTSDSGSEEAALLDLLGADGRSDDGTRILVIAGGLLAFAILLVGATAWFRRSSRYFPA
jgi:plastocyanin